MTGNVYSLPISDGGENNPHPHVLALELQSDVVLIPAFTEGKPYVEAKLAAAAKIYAVDESVVGVRMDNAKCVTFTDGRTPNRAVWLLVRRQKVEKRIIHTAKKIGMMSDDGLLEIVEGMLRLAVQVPDDVSPSLQKKLRRLATDLSARKTPKVL